jgi:hypothetical protein
LLKVDFRVADSESCAAIVQRHKGTGNQFLAEKVERRPNSTTRELSATVFSRLFSASRLRSTPATFPATSSFYLRQLEAAAWPAISNQAVEDL